MNESPTELLNNKAKILDSITRLSEVERTLFSLKLFSDAKTLHDVMQSLACSIGMIEEQLDNMEKD